MANKMERFESNCREGGATRRETLHDDSWLHMGELIESEKGLFVDTAPSNCK